MSKQEKLSRINQRPMGDTPSTVSTAGVYLGRTGSELGNWKVGPNSLSSGQVILCADGWIQVGDDSGTVRLDAQHPTYRLWAGADDPTIAPFTLDTAGNVRMQGEIDAASGSIAGWQIAPQSLSNADAILSSLGYLQLGTGDNIVRVDAQNATYRLWAGKADAATAPFRVTAGGALTATDAEITGQITAKAGELGTLDVTGTLTLIDPAVIKSNNYITGAKGWKIDANGDAELWNVKVRGELRSAVLVYEETSVLGGDMVLAKSAGTLSSDYTVGGIMIVDGTAWRFATGDMLHIRAWDVTGNNLGDTWLTVTRTENVNEYTTTYESGSQGLTYPAGTAVADYGVSGQGIVQLTSRAPLGPSVSIQTSSATPWAGVTEHARLGNLRNSFGIGDTDTMGLALGDYAGNQYIRWDGTDLRVSGKVYLYPGATKTLADWTHPSDHTLIDGGSIFTGSITSNKLTVRGNNYLGNPDFETGDMREWVIYSGEYVGMETAMPYSGKYAICVEGNGADRAALSSERIATGPGARWSASSWVRALSGNGEAFLRLVFWNASYGFVSDATGVKTLSSSWEQATVQAVAPAGAAYVSLWLGTMPSVALGEYVGFDACELISSIPASQVMLYPGAGGTLADWTHPIDHTLIDGANIYTGSILANQILITQGQTKTLADWGHPSDRTLIDGGNIYANSITASKITMRGNNYLGNPNFETGDLRDWSVWTGRNVYVPSNGGGPYSGGYCCHVEGSGTDTPALTSGRVPTGPGSRWFGAAWLRGIVGAGTVAVQLIWFKATGEYLSHVDKTLDVTGTWTRVVVEGVAPTDARYVALQVFTTASLATGEWIGIDSCELIKSDVSVNITDDIKLNLDGLHILNTSVWTGWGADSKAFNLYTSYDSGHQHSVSFSIVGHRIKINDVWHIAIAM